MEEACNFTKSNTHPWVFFTFLKLYKWHQIAQRTTYLGKTVLPLLLNGSLTMLLCSHLNPSFVFRDLWFSFVPVSQYYFKDLRKKWTFRRLSTKSFVIDGKDTVGATIWKWYWQKSDTEWQEYSGSVCFLSLLFRV